MALQDRSVPANTLFDGVEADLDAIRHLLTRRDLVEGEHLMVQDTPSTFFAMIESGTAVVERTRDEKTVVIATVGTGDILGELGLLRNQPRLASVRATSAMTAWVGDTAAFESLLSVPSVHERMRSIVGARLAQHADPIEVPMAGKPTILLRPLLPSDRPGLQRAAHEASAETLRRRFFTSVTPSERMLDYLVFVDYVDHFAWVAMSESGDGMGIGRYIRSHDDPDRAEFAFTVADAWQGNGVGSRLLGSVGVAARSAGITWLDAHFLADNGAAKALFSKADATFGRSEPGVLDTSFTSTAAAALLDPVVATQLQDAAGQIVRTAGLALTSGTDPHR